MTPSTITFDVPQSVWLDTLDPLTSGMQAELVAEDGLPLPVYVKRGRGGSYRYVDAPVAAALELAKYIGDRGVTLLNQSVSDPYDPIEKAERDTYRNAIKCAERIRKAVAAS
jgi:hypothetical protein